MNRDLEIALLKELHGLQDNGQFFLDDDVQTSPVARYACPDRFSAEQARIFRASPAIAAHVSELPDPGSFLTRDFFGLPLLLTRDREGEIHAFLNVCRHRGATLVGETSGCKNSFSCPYHAWTYSSNGTLRGVPHEKPGFPGIDKKTLGLRAMPAAERSGLIWVIADPKCRLDEGLARIDDHTAPLAEDFAWCAMEDLGIATQTTIVRNSNWKLLMEGGIEAYHFKVAHKSTIGPHFMDNLSSYAMLGTHMRSILPRTSLPDLDLDAPANWSIRDHANVLYTVFPTDQFLVMQDHIGWMAFQPLSEEQTEIRLTTLAPRSEITEERAPHWERNQQITTITLSEDFDINEAVQSGLKSGANEELTFGRYEGALHAFNAEVEARLG